jgi:heptosyltransferase-1
LLSVDRHAPLKVLIVKLSSLGDVVHTMPAVMDIQAAFPHAQIDWVVERGFAPLAARCAAVHRVIPCELRRWRKAFLKSDIRAQTRADWQAFKADLQRDAYDVVIDLQGLTKSALVAWLARTTPQGKRYAMANRTDGSGYERPTRWVADVAIRITPHIHAVDRGRALRASLGLFRACAIALRPGPTHGMCRCTAQTHRGVGARHLAC